MKRFFKATVLPTLPSLILTLAWAAIASAQIGGPHNTKRVANDGRKTTTPAKAPASVSQRFEKEGIVINFSVEAKPTEKGESAGLVAGANAVATFSVTDARTGQPLTGLRPMAWISSRTSAQPPSEAVCKDKIRNFIGGLLSVRPEIDLNRYLALTLNHDNTITIINPLVSFSKTKLEGIVQLPGAGADWALSPSQEFLYVTLPEQSSVAVVNVITRKIVATIVFQEKTKPRRIALQPDGRYVWVGLDDSTLVAAIDTATNKLAARISVGAGLHNLAFTPDSRFLYVTNSAADTVSVIDTKKLARVADLNVGKTPVPVAYSSASRLVYVASINGGSVSAIDPAKQQVIKSIPTKRGVVALRFEPKGRYGFLVNQVENTVTVLDASTNSLVGGAEVVKGPDQVTFTARYAYVRGTGSEKVSLIDLGEVAKGKVTVVDVTAGRLPASNLPQEIGVADMIAPTPDGNAVLIANAPDQMMYYYVEGMMAPMGTISNYKRRPRALLLINRSLTETAPGVYSTPIKLTRAGLFDVPLLIDQPRAHNCFQLEVAESPDAEKNRTGVSIAVEALFKEKRFKPQDTISLRFKITDLLTKQPVAGLDDVQVLVFEPPGIWQQRQWAKDVGGGVYEVTQTFPRAGLYHVMLRVASRNVAYADLPFTAVSVIDSAPQAEERKNADDKRGTENE
ncbi:MAG TPA: FixH family protein [Pyrinomonadaceae bacterium]